MGKGEYQVKDVVNLQVGNSVGVLVNRVAEENRVYHVQQHTCDERLYQPRHDEGQQAHQCRLLYRSRPEPPHLHIPLCLHACVCVRACACICAHMCVCTYVFVSVPVYVGGLGVCTFVQRSVY